MTIVEKIKVAELMAESNFTKQNLKIEVLWQAIQNGTINQGNEFKKIMKKGGKKLWELEEINTWQET